MTAEGADDARDNAAYIAALSPATVEKLLAACEAAERAMHADMITFELIDAIADLQSTGETGTGETT